MHQDNTKAAVKQVQHLTGRKTESRSNKFVWHLPFPVLSSSCCYFSHSGEEECGRCCLDPSSLQGHLAALFIASSLSLVFLGDDADFGETNKSNTIILDPALPSIQSLPQSLDREIKKAITDHRRMSLRPVVRKISDLFRSLAVNSYWRYDQYWNEEWRRRFLWDVFVIILLFRLMIDFMGHKATLTPREL